MLRCLYSIRFTPPTRFLNADDKVRYYCNVVVVADKYDLPPLAQAALRGLTTFVTSLDEASLLLDALVVLTDEYSDFESLEQCATRLAKPRLKELTSLPTFPTWLAKRRLIVQDLVDDAAELNSKYKSVKPMKAWQCTSCKNVILVTAQPKYCKNPCRSAGTAYVNQHVHGSTLPLAGSQ
jgi:hypothetical protein